MNDRDDFAAAAWAVMSGSRYYDVYDVQGEAEAICRWLCEDESGDIWRVVPLVPCDATPQARATSGECSVPTECTEPVAWAVVYQPQPTLTDEERGAVDRAAQWLRRWQETHGYHSAESGDLATLRGLLERTK
jgi:hypothetical protein